METNGGYKYLMKKTGSRYKQLMVNGRIKAEVLYRETVGTEPLTPEEVAREYSLPLEAVLEAIHYSVNNQAILDADRQMETDTIKKHGLDRWPYAPRDYKPEA